MANERNQVKTKTGYGCTINKDLFGGGFGEVRPFYKEEKRGGRESEREGISLKLN